MKSLPLILVVLVLIAGGVLAFHLWSRGNPMNNQRGAQVADQSHRSYEMELISKADGIEAGKPTTITYKIKNDKGDVLKNYEIVHEKVMHFIVVRKDLQDFQHIHPEFNESSGEFTVNVTFPNDGPYRVFPDFTSGDDNPQKLPATVFADLNIGDIKNYKSQVVVADNQPNKAVNGYDISYTWPGVVEQQKEVQFSLTVNRNDQPVTNLENYLGALGHSVILKADRLDFIHTHALDGSMGQMPGMDHSMEDMSSGMSMDGENGPQIKFATTFPSLGIYKVFTQFQHQGKVVTSDYVVKVK